MRGPPSLGVVRASRDEWFQTGRGRPPVGRARAQAGRARPRTSEGGELADLREAQMVARGIAEGRVDAVGPLLGLVHELDAARLELLVGRVDVVRGQEDRPGAAL